MSDHDVEAMLGALKPEGLPESADAAILAAIREARRDLNATPHKATPVYVKPVPAWAAAAACILAGVLSWHVRGRAGPAGGLHGSGRGLSDVATTPVVPHVHVQSDLFVSTPSRVLDITHWSPVAGAEPENQS